MTRTPRLLTAALVAVLAACARAPTAFTWDPGWAPGMYWVVRTPHFKHHADLVTGKDIEERDGYVYARFVVKSIDPGAGMVLMLKWKVNDEFSYDEQPDSLELGINLKRLSYRRSVFRRDDHEPGGEHFERESTSGIAPELNVFGFPLEHPETFPETLTLTLPIVRQAEHGWTVSTTTSEVEPESGQEVKLDGPSAAIVTVHDGEGAWFWRYRFENGKPWFELLDEEGKPLQEIVEVGKLP